MMGLIEGAPTKRDAELAAEATRESWQALLDRLGMLTQAKSLPERQSIRNDVLGAIHVHMARRSYENRINWQIEHGSTAPKPAAPSEPIPSLSAKPIEQAPEPAQQKRAPFGPLPETEPEPTGTTITIESRTPDYSIHRVKGIWRGKYDEARKLIEEDARKEYPFGYRELRIDADDVRFAKPGEPIEGKGTFSYVGHTD